MKKNLVVMSLDQNKIKPWESGSILLSLQINLPWNGSRSQNGFWFWFVCQGLSRQNKVETAEFRLEHPQACFYVCGLGLTPKWPWNIWMSSGHVKVGGSHVGVKWLAFAAFLPTAVSFLHFSFPSFRYNVSDGRPNRNFFFFFNHLLENSRWTFEMLHFSYHSIHHGTSSNAL